MCLGGATAGDKDDVETPGSKPRLEAPVCLLEESPGPVTLARAAHALTRNKTRLACEILTGE